MVREVVIEALDDPDWCVRSAAIQALANIGDLECVGHILKKLEDPEDIVKKEAISALGILGSKDAVNLLLTLIHKENLQDKVLSTLEKLGIPDLDAFCGFFKQSNTRLKCRLIDLLTRLRGPDVVDFLISIIEEREQ